MAERRIPAPTGLLIALWMLAGAISGPAVAAQDPHANTPTCFGKTRIAGKRAVDFIAHCQPPSGLAVAHLPLMGIRATLPVARVRSAASVGGNPMGMSCFRRTRNRIGCTATVDPTGQTIRGRFWVKGDRCGVTSTFKWNGGGCVGYDPTTDVCADVGLGAVKRFGPPAGC